MNTSTKSPSDYTKSIDSLLNDLLNNRSFVSVRFSGNPILVHSFVNDSVTNSNSVKDCAYSKISLAYIDKSVKFKYKLNVLVNNGRPRHIKYNIYYVIELSSAQDIPLIDSLFNWKR